MTNNESQQLPTTSVNNVKTDEYKVWEQRHQHIKVLWVVAVLAFWCSGVLLLILYQITGKISLINSSVIVATLILGTVLKTKAQLHERKKPKIQYID